MKLKQEEEFNVQEMGLWSIGVNLIGGHVRRANHLCSCITGTLGTMVILSFMIGSLATYGSSFTN
jgi:hypothetical protein